MAPQSQQAPDALLYTYTEGGKRPRSARVESFRPLHQPMYHLQPRLGTSSSSQGSSRSQSTPMLATGIDYGKAMRTLWDLQGIEMRKVQESAAHVAPGINALQRSQSAFGNATCSAPGRDRVLSKSHDKRCEEVLGRLVRDSDHWGIVQERQARLLDTNRYLTRHSENVRRETKREVKSGTDLLNQTFSTSQDVWRSSRKPAAFASSVSFPTQSSTDLAYGVENLHRLAKQRCMAKTTTGHEKTAAISMWGSH